jgi:hypothetical protein
VAQGWRGHRAEHQSGGGSEDAGEHVGLGCANECAKLRMCSDVSAIEFELDPTSKTKLLNPVTKSGLQNDVQKECG